MKKRRTKSDAIRLCAANLALAATLSSSAFGQDVPFAAMPSSRLGSCSQAYYASLSDIMGVIQLRHIKLWDAGTSGDWRVASFEINQIEETFFKAGIIYTGIPVAYVLSVREPLDSMRQAASAGDRLGFTRSFEGLTNSCNQCHEAAKVGFIVIKTPTSSPFTDEKF